MFAPRIVLIAGAALLCACANDKISHEKIEVDNGQAFIEQCAPGDAWDKPAPPFRLYGDSYYVGTCGITSVLIAGDEGHVIIDGGPRNGGPLVAANVEALGFRMKDVKILLHTHEHFDHVGGLAYLQEVSGAKVIASEAAAPVLSSGIVSAEDPQSGMHDPFAPVVVSRTVGEGDKVRLGRLELTPLPSPGHTPGALSWSWRDCEGGDCKTIVYMDSFTPVSGEGYRFSDHPDHVARFRASLARIAETPCDIALTPHPAASEIFSRIASDVGLIDNRECKLYVDDMAVALEKRLAREAGQTAP